VRFSRLILWHNATKTVNFAWGDKNSEVEVGTQKARVVFFGRGLVGQENGGTKGINPQFSPLVPKASSTTAYDHTHHQAVKATQT